MVGRSPRWKIHSILSFALDFRDLRITWQCCFSSPRTHCCTCCNHCSYHSHQLMLLYPSLPTNNFCYHQTLYTLFSHQQKHASHKIYYRSSVCMSCITQSNEAAWYLVCTFCFMYFRSCSTGWQYRHLQHCRNVFQYVLLVSGPAIPFHSCILRTTELVGKRGPSHLFVSSCPLSPSFNSNDRGTPSTRVYLFSVSHLQYDTDRSKKTSSVEYEACAARLSKVSDVF